MLLTHYNAGSSRSNQNILSQYRFSIGTGLWQEFRGADRAFFQQPTIGGSAMSRYN